MFNGVSDPKYDTLIREEDNLDLYEIPFFTRFGREDGSFKVGRSRACKITIHLDAAGEVNAAS